MTGDERRSFYRADLSPLYIPAYDALCALLPEAWQPYYGIRSVQEQNDLYAKGRSIPPIGGQFQVTKAPGGASAHNYGCATDWTIYEDKKPVWLQKSDLRWKTYSEACEKVGLEWGGLFSSITDYYHNELKLRVSWAEVKHVLVEKGMEAAVAFISEQRYT